MSDRYEVPAGFAGDATIDAAAREALYARSLADPDGFWLDEARRLDWVHAPTRAGDWSFAEADFHVRWFADGKLNVAANCLDRHVAERGGQTAILWEPDDPAESPRAFTYAETLAEVCRFANVLRTLGVAKGDRVTLYMPMIPEAAFAMLACARLGAIHSVVFGGFSADALRSRITDCGSTLVVTADEGRRGGRRFALKKTVDQALEGLDGVAVVVVRATGGDVVMREGRDHWYHECAGDAATTCDPEPMDAEDPLFILYTSGSTGKPKGVMHTQAGYLLWATTTFATTFDYRPGEVFWCSADVGWVTGHSYIVYGPLANGATTLMYEGVPNWPTSSRIWQVVDRHRVATLYTAPTALRALMREGDEAVKSTDRSSLRLLGTVGEPINPEAWRWYAQVVGEGRCPIVDTWWQTETGGHMITPLPGAVATKPGSATLPFFGVEPKLLDARGSELHGEAEGALVIARSWPGQMRGVWGDERRFFETYFRTFPGHYDTGDGARRDADGYWWITGRTDDVINVSGHRMGTAEVESALVLDEQVAEAAVVGMPHEVKGQGIYAFVTLNAGVAGDEATLRRLRDRVRAEIGAIATPDAIQFAPALPKTRSGKIMRRILRKIAAGDTGDLGDTSTLADPAVVDDLVANRVA
ncbi:acetate--CoA ligase [Sphingomonas sp.]|uniref:acetate--CoA ligase n=1 Tax=Sphingomonas sp. TaxID=28214 RepID=UPI003B0064A7